jgi:thiamine-monophosphate kinase
LPGSPLPGEFELIRRYFAPLARDVPGALGLADDACTLSVPAGEELVLTADGLVAGVHFLSTDAPDRIARKMLRVNLSDLAAKGARPIGYLMTLAFDATIDEAWVAAFVQGLASDQDRYGVGLLGGDTVLTPGPLSLSVTAIGSVAKGNALRRNGARPGDRILVTGTIGDGYLGLKALRGAFADLTEKNRRFLVDRYQLPDPPVAFGTSLGRERLANAGMDISDGLLGDLAHLCEASRCGARVSAQTVPISETASELLAHEPDLFAGMMTGGDDYELLLAVPAAAVARVQALAGEHGTRATEIGAIAEGAGVLAVDRDQRPIDVPIAGFTHF